MNKLITKTKHLFYASGKICLCITFQIWASLCFAESTEATTDLGPTSYDTLVTQLVSANFSEKLSLIDKIENTAGVDALPLLNALKNGELFFEKKDKQKVVQARKDEAGDYKITNVTTQELIIKIDTADFKEAYKKIRINNRLRQKIKLSLSRITLVSGNEADKIKALNELMSGLNEDSAKLIESLYNNEPSDKVKALMSVMFAIHTLNSSRDTSNIQLTQVSEALKTLEGRLETPVRIALNNYLEFLQNESDTFEEGKTLTKKVNSVIHSIEEDVEFYLFVEKLFFGLSLGSVLLLAAIGLAITFGVMGVINMAHGEMIMLGAYTTYVVQLMLPNLIQYSLFIAVPAAFMVAALVGILIQRSVIRYLHGRPLETLLATFGISLILRQAVRTIFSPLNRQVNQPSWMSGALEINPVLSLTYNRLYILIFSLIVFAALVFVIKKTWLGLKVRAVSQNRAMAKSMGVRTEWVDALTFGLGSGVAGVAGVALSQLTNVGPNLGQAYIVDSFMVVVFGGVGNLMGTLVASFSLGVANKFMEPITGAVLANILVLVFIILFIQKRPKGLFPQRGRAAE